MCGGVSFDWEGEALRVFFPNPKAVLPVRTKGQGSRLIAWGRRKTQPGHLPLGGWARQESVRAGVWARWSPRPVKIAVERFMEKDQDKQSHWTDLQTGEFIQGLLACDGDQLRVYVVTTPARSDQAVHERWPRILTAM